MKKLIFVFLCLFQLFAYGQKDSVTCKHYLSVYISEVVKTGVRFTYEYKFRNRQSFLADGGYKFNAISYSPVGFDMLAEPDGISSYAHKAIYAGLGYNYFFFTNKSGRFQTFASASLNYRYSYNDLIVNVNGRDGSYTYNFQSIYASRYELKLLLGFRKLSAIKLHQPSAFFEWFLGGGFSTENYRGIDYGYSSGSNACPIAANTAIRWYDLQPFHLLHYYARVCFGFKLGLAWKKHKNIW